MRRLPLVITTCVIIAATSWSLRAQEATPVKGFSVVVLLGEALGSVQAQGLPSAAQKALADVKEFLPYKGYRVLDTQWVAGSDFGVSTGRIRIDEKDYEFRLETFPTAIPKPNEPRPLGRARFVLRTPAIGTGPSGPLGVSTMLDNQFAIKPGETVVVGTSRTQGDNALIVLLTAVRAGK